jgi:hypothetical protein
MYGWLLLLASGATADVGIRAAAARPDAVLRWNEAALEAIRTERTPPPLAARNLAIVHAAIYDAVNAANRTHQPYRYRGDAPPGTAPDVAASLAAHRTLVALYPKQVELFDAVLDETLAAAADGEGKTNGMRVGKGVAEDLLARRRHDGASQRVAYRPGTEPGQWRPTPPLFQEALLPQWPYLTCFCLKSGAQFRPGGPPALTSDDYAASFREVKLLGGTRSAVRTEEQTAIARFWADEEGTSTPPGHWNRIAQAMAKERRLGLAENARLFALLNLALADAAVASWDCKYAYNVWRPIDGIREADPARHRDTIPERDWTPLLTTPPFPSYTSGHSTFSGAAAAVLASFFGTDEVRFTSTSESLPGVTRTFTRFSAAAQEAGKSRIYGGIHWEFDNREGLKCGREVGEYVYRNFLQPRAVPE